MNKAEFLASLTPETRKRITDATDYEPKLFATPSLGLTLALGGGFGEGRQIMVWGQKSAGKSSFCQQFIGMHQKNGAIAAWVDAENSFHAGWARRLGVNTEELILDNRSKTTAQVANSVVDYVKNGIDIVVVDSLSVLLPSSFIADKKKKADDFELKPLEETGQIGKAALEADSLMKMVNSVNRKSIVILISQVRTDISSYGAPGKPTGGRSPIFNCSQIIRLWSSEGEKKQVKGFTTLGDRLVEVPVGREVTWKVDYNKVGNPGRTGEYDFIFHGDQVGIDNAKEIVQLSKQYGIIPDTTWVEWDEQKFNGENQLITYFKENEVAYEKLKASLYERL